MSSISLGDGRRHNGRNFAQHRNRKFGMRTNRGADLPAVKLTADGRARRREWLSGYHEYLNRLQWAEHEERR